MISSFLRSDRQGAGNWRRSFLHRVHRPNIRQHSLTECILRRSRETRRLRISMDFERTSSVNPLDQALETSLLSLRRDNGTAVDVRGIDVSLA
jgi:hypothetical protein